MSYTLPLLSAEPFLRGATGPIVSGAGPIPCDVMVIGEAPGEEEEKRKKPFVGPAGQFLDSLFEKAHIDRELCFITNAVKRRPAYSTGATRNPTTKEVEVWAPLLWQEIENVKPKFVLLLGNAALKAIFPDAKPITKVRGVVRTHPKGFQVLATFHPSAVLRNTRDLRPVVEGDLMQFKKLVDGGDVSRYPKKHKVILTVSAARELCEKLLEADKFALDIETTSLDWTSGEILCISFSRQPGEAYVIPLLGQYCTPAWSPEDKQEIDKILDKILGSDVPKIGQNAKFDIEYLRHSGYEVKNLQYDTLVEHHLIDENLPHNLEFIAAYELGEPGHDEELKKYLPTSTTTYDKAPERVLWKYTCHDSDYTFAAHNKFTDILLKTNTKGYNFYREWLMPLENALINMEMRGILVDTEKCEALRKRYQNDLMLLDEFIHKEIGRDININSWQQLSDLFFKERGYKPTKTTKGGSASVDENVLKYLAEKDEIAEAVLQHRELSKIISTYLDGISTRISSDGRIHSSYLMTGTVTWRISSKDPNMQNVPVDLRNIFVPPKGCVFGEADYSQIELLVLGGMAKEDAILTAYRNKIDLHKAAAVKIYGVALSDVTDELRQKAKGLNFGIIYRMTVWGLASRLGISEIEAGELLENYFMAFPAIRPWQNSIIKHAKKVGYVESAFGFRRHLNFSNAKTDKEIEAIERQAVNSPIQGSAYAITARGHVRLERLFGEGKLKSEIIGTVHDSLGFYIPESCWQEEVEAIRTVLQQEVPELGVIPRVAFKVGRFWGDKSLLNEE